ncbi:MAG: DUF6712 family protein [Bacteroides sp.]|uniref:hypothetical protein n=1 Tax=Bacteroides sp. TaxID=29523 RepID=UPI002FC668DB
MTILEELFKTIEELRKYVPSVESNTTFDQLNSSATSAKKQISALISSDAYKYALDNTGEIHSSLLTAMANLTLSKQLVFDAITRRKAGVEVYKYELEAMKRSFVENYYNGMDTLIQLLDKDTTEGNKWRESRYYKIIETLKIKDTDNFDLLYPIDLSYLFFFRTVPLQKEVLEEGMKGYFDRAKDNEDAMNMLLRALAKMTVAIALRRFDIIEFPSTIRNLFEDSKVNRSGRDEQLQMLSLSEQLSAEVKALLQDVDLILSTNDSTTIDTESTYNTPDDKIVMMP